MTRRALIIGILGAIVFAAGGSYVNTFIPGPNMVRGHLPISVFGLLILFAIGINPLLRLVKKSWAFKPSELALVHRQWARRERIRYPIAEIASSLLMQDEKGRTPVFHNKLFWLGLGGQALVRDSCIRHEKSPATYVAGF